MAPGSTKSRRSARKFALREDGPAAQFEVSQRKETTITKSGRKKTVVIEESLRDDPPAPPPQKKRKTTSAPQPIDNNVRPDEDHHQPDLDIVTGHNRPCRVCRFDVVRNRPAQLTMPRLKRIILFNLYTVYNHYLKPCYLERLCRRRIRDAAIARTKTGPSGGVQIAAWRK